VVVSILKILGKDIKLNYIHKFDKIIWDMSEENILKLKDLLLEIHNPNFRPLTK